MSDRIRIIRNDGRITVLDYAFSQMVEMTGGLTREDRRAFDDGQEIVIAVDTVFAKIGERAKIVRL